jgi:hypothetical protein
MLDKRGDRLIVRQDETLGRLMQRLLVGSSGGKLVGSGLACHVRLRTISERSTA